MSANGRRKPPRPRIELVSGGASEGEAAAIVAALEQFLADTAPAPDEGHAQPSRWLRTALEEGVSARRISGQAWGQVPQRDEGPARSRPRGKETQWP